jgi:hypothetical protein
MSDPRAEVDDLVLTTFPSAVASSGERAVAAGRRATPQHAWAAHSSARTRVDPNRGVLEPAAFGEAPISETLSCAWRHPQPPRDRT